jgi:hypothetical protein
MSALVRAVTNTGTDGASVPELGRERWRRAYLIRWTVMNTEVLAPARN